MQRDDVRVWWRQRRRQLFPAEPTTWSEALRRLRPPAARIGRLTGAAVLAYLGSALFSRPVVDLTAPLTALLVVQASTVSTLRMGLVRVGAVLTGVLLAIAVSAYVGLSWWSLAIVIIAALLMARLLRLGPQSLETAISAMLILGVSAHGPAAEIRVVNTLIGAAVGIAVSLLVPVAIPNTRARDAVRDVARAQGRLLDHVAQAMGSRLPSADEADGWLDTAHSIETRIDDARRAVDAVEENRKLNPRALAALRIHPALRVALGRLERIGSAQRALVTVIAQRAARGEAPPERSDELRGVFSVVLDHLAAAMDAFGELIASEREGPAERARDRLSEVVAEARAVLTELTMINVDARTDRDVWVLQGSILAAVDEILRQLDLEHPEQTTAAWDPRPGLERVPGAWAQTSQRLGQPVRRQIETARRSRDER